MNKRPIAIDLFSGAGGLSLGFEQAGFDVLAAAEVDPIHASTHKYNFPECVVFAQSVSEVTAERIRSETAIADEEIAVVVGGPPCQGFSLIGQRVLDDPRNALVRDFVRIVKETAPRHFLFENVRGLTVGVQRQVLDELVEELDAIGYTVTLPWKVLNAVNYGLPQDRERLFLLGTRSDCRAPSYPDPLTVPPSQAPSLDLFPEAPTCEAALGDLPDAESYDELNLLDCVRTSDWGPGSPYAQEMRCLADGCWHLGYRRNWDSGLLTSSARTNHTAISKRRFMETSPGDVEPISRFYKLPARGVSNTLRAGTDSARGAFTSPRPIHYKYGRCVTVREMARLHGFPDWFRFHRTKWYGARQIGNAVPPPLARSLAGEFVRALDIAPSVPELAMDIGDPALLLQDMTQAAAYWGVAVPIGRRDRRSGAKKRKQAEIEALSSSTRPV